MLLILLTLTQPTPLQEDRMTPERKRQQMLLLEEAMHDARMDFNHRFLALREVKRKVIQEINGR